MEMQHENLKKCRNCYYEVRKGIGKCPYCGKLNPTIELKEIFITIFFVIIVMSIFTFFN